MHNEETEKRHVIPGCSITQYAGKKYLVPQYNRVIFF